MNGGRFGLLRGVQTPLGVMVTTSFCRLAVAQVGQMIVLGRSDYYDDRNYIVVTRGEKLNGVLLALSDSVIYFLPNF